VDFVAELARPATVEEINSALKNAANGSLKGILAYCDLPLVSRDFNDNANSSIVDSLSTMVVEGSMAKVVAWYDNEWGYSNRIVDLIAYIGRRGL
jgi:glyceraldehyde 3-phosphate dehydrogenase